MPASGLLGGSKKSFETTKTDASEIFGQGSNRIKYTDPNSGGMIDVLQKPDGTASILGLEVPEQMRGQGIGQSLQSQVMQDFPEMMGQVSSKAAAKTAYRLGRRPPNQPEATLDDVYKIMDEYSSVNLVSPDMQKRFMQSLLD
jgi:predicted GNAT family acetyltransferase